MMSFLQSDIGTFSDSRFVLHTKSIFSFLGTFRIKKQYIYTLGVLIFAGTNFREFVLF